MISNSLVKCLKNRRGCMFSKQIVTCAENGNKKVLCEHRPNSTFMDPKCKVAIITGGTSGIGFATAAELLYRGAKGVVITGSMGLKGLLAAKQLCLKFGSSKAVFVRADVNDAVEFYEVFQYALYRYNRLDILVNNAGVLDEEDWEEELGINTIGTIRGTIMAQEFMSKHKNGQGGVIVNVAGTMGLEPLAAAPTYSASKHAIVGFSRSIGAPFHYMRTGLRVITICPGFTKSNQLAVLGKMTKPLRKELEDTIKYSCKQNPEAVALGIFHTIKHGISGSVWVVDGSALYLVQFPKRFDISKFTAQYS